MPLLRLITVLVLAGSCTLFLASNSGTLVSLTVFGMAMPKLPLSLWMAIALGAGAATHVAIGTLYSLSSYFTARQVRRTVQPDPSPRRFGFGRRSDPEDNREAPWDNWPQNPRSTPGNPTAVKPPNPTASSRPRDTGNQDMGRETGTRDAGNRIPLNLGRTPVSEASPKGNRPPVREIDTGDDWDAPMRDDWEEGPDDRSHDRSHDRPRNSSAPPNTPPLNLPRDRSQPPSENRPTDTQPRDTRDRPVSRDRVVDADFRVIVPPLRSPDSPPRRNTASQDWHEDEGDDFR